MIEVKPGALRRRLHAAALLSAMLLSGCGVFDPRGLSFPWMYRMPVEQGNLYDSEDVAQLEIGMSRSETLEIMGAPMLRDPLHKNRWDYLYLLEVPGQAPVRHHLVLLFDGNALREIIERTPSPAPRGERGPSRRADGASPSGQ